MSQSAYDDVRTNSLIKGLDATIDRLILIGLAYKAAVVALLLLILWRVW